MKAQISFTGWLDTQEVYKELSKANIFVLPSWSEGMPNALIESMAAGLCCITTSVGMIPDYLVSYDNAVLTNPKDVEMLESALETVILDKDLREDIAYRGHIFAKEHFSTENQIDKLLNVINDI